MSHHDLHLFQTNMIVKDNSAYDKGIADFFGDPARAEEFSKLGPGFEPTTLAINDNISSLSLVD